MNYLQTTHYGNTVQDWLISLAILVSSLLIAKYVYEALRKTVCEWLSRDETALEKESVARVCALTTYLIAIVGFAFAQNRLLFDEMFAKWVNIGLVIAGQIIFMLILIAAIESVLKGLPSKSMRIAGHDNRKYLKAQEQTNGKTRKAVKALSRALLIIVPVLTLLTYLDRVPPDIWVLPGVIILIMAKLCFRINRIPKRKSTQAKITTVKFESGLEVEPSAILNDPQRRNKEALAELFLNIFKHQLRAPKEAPAEFRLIDSLSFAPNYIYELRIKINDDWQSRRMTIGPLGEDGTSRSKCFYVIYDYHLVIKIPPKPIRNLNEYMRMIKKERSIVQKLSMQECIIPSVSVIFKMLQWFSDGTKLPMEENEENCVKWLSFSPELQDYLKIGDSFVFFMDLSKYYFLQNIIESFHTIKKPVYDDICLDSELAWDSSKFEDKYGSGNGSVFLRVERIYREYKTQVTKLIAQYNIPVAISQHQIKEWFFVYLAGSMVTETGNKLKADFITALNRLLERIINDDIKTIHNYKAIVKSHVHESRFIQNKAYMEGIITNLLELLAYLRNKQVAMRDLKPDNLLIAGDRERYPAFLACPEEYTIGLIDVETAAIIDKSRHSMILQPLLGGTPQYATPSHLFNNQLLIQVYGDLSRILHLQDWHAVIAMIYKIAIGRNLFEETAELFPRIVVAVNETSGHGNELSDMMIAVNQMYWNSAVSEFKTKLSEKNNIFKSLDIVIADAAKKMLKDFVLNEKQEISRKIRQWANSKNIPFSAGGRHHLLSCSYEEASKLRENCEKRYTARGAASIDKGRIISFLEKLERLKLELARKTKMLDFLAQSTVRISAFELLEIMFDIVLKDMYKEEWRCVVLEESSASVDADMDSKYRTTIEATIEWPTAQA